jgi:hypothetical protein
MNSLGAQGNGFDRGGSGPSDCIAYPNLYQVFGSQGATVASQIQASSLECVVGFYANGRAVQSFYMGPIPSY